MYIIKNISQTLHYLTTETGIHSYFYYMQLRQIHLMIQLSRRILGCLCKNAELEFEFYFAFSHVGYNSTSLKLHI